jgi:hypothetical protein
MVKNPEMLQFFRPKLLSLPGLYTLRLDPTYFMLHIINLQRMLNFNKNLYRFWVNKNPTDTILGKLPQKLTYVTAKELIRLRREYKRNEIEYFIVMGHINSACCRYLRFKFILAANNKAPFHVFVQIHMQNAER